MIYASAPKMAKYSNDHSSETGPPQKKCSMNLHMVTHLIPIYSSKFQNLGGGGQKNLTTF